MWLGDRAGTAECGTLSAERVEGGAWSGGCELQETFTVSWDAAFFPSLGKGRAGG